MWTCVRPFLADGFYTHATAVPSRLITTANHFYTAGCTTRSEPLYPKKLEGSVVSSRVSGTHDRHPADQSRVIKP
jgi:hypothetical protein